VTDGQLAMSLPAPLGTTPWSPGTRLRAGLSAVLESAARLPYKAGVRGAALPGRPVREAWVANTEAADRIAWERTLLRRIRAGERAAFAELYRAYAPVLYRRVLLPKLGAPGAAEDALAETFRTAFVKLDSYEDQGVSIYHWLSRIASNKAIDMHRARARTDRALTQLEGLLAPLEQPGARDPFGELSARRDQAALEARITEALSALNPRYRRAIELRFLEERERPACAEALEVKLGTFDVLLLRALRAFRRAWDEREASGASAPRVPESEAQDD
jgi:RNA polymerase sigma-70 factor (ECF subfamily)